MATEPVPARSEGQPADRARSLSVPPGSSGTRGAPGTRRSPGEQPPAPFWQVLAKLNRVAVGWILVVAGLVAILLGWFGVSGQALVAKQLPYLVSGGLLGVVLVSLGAVVLGTEDIRRDSGRLDRLERMVLELHAVLLARADAPDRSLLERLDLTTGNGGGGSGPAGPDEESLSLVALPEGQTYHRASCAMVTGKAHAAPVTAGTARRRGLKPCRLCEPAAVAG